MRLERVEIRGSRMIPVERIEGGGLRVARMTLHLTRREGRTQNGTFIGPNATNFRRDDLGTFKVTRVPSTFLLRIVSFLPGPAGCRSNLDRRRVRQQVQGSNRLLSIASAKKSRGDAKRERERKSFSPLLHRDSASLLPFQGYSCVAFRTGTFQHFRFALSS